VNPALHKVKGLTMKGRAGVKLIVGLGNPGKAYLGSRHNIGFSVIRAMARARKAALRRDSGISSFVARCNIGNHNVLLAMPFTFMNLAGVAVRAAQKKYKIDLDDLCVISDDLDLEFGRIRIRPAGSSGGHRGLESIINSLKSSDFTRLRIGVGRPPIGVEASDYVLSSFTSQEKKKLAELILQAQDCCEAWIREGATGSRNLFNVRSRDNE